MKTLCFVPVSHSILKGFQRRWTDSLIEYIHVSQSIVDMKDNMTTEDLFGRRPITIAAVYDRIESLNRFLEISPQIRLKEYWRFYK